MYPSNLHQVSKIIVLQSYTVYKISIVYIKIILIYFFTDKDIPNVIAYAFGVVMDVAVPFPLENPEVCKNPDSGIKCPLKQDQEAEYKTTFAIEKIIPAVIRLKLNNNINLFLF